MKRVLELKLHLRRLEALGVAIGAMKSLSAHHLRQVRSGVAPARSYREGVERIVAAAGAAIGAGAGEAGLLVIGSELGLCGSYNARVVEAGARRRSELGPGPTLCVGRRAAILLARRGVEIEATYPSPTSASGITGLLLRLAEDILVRYAHAHLASFDIVSSRFAGAGTAHPASVRLLPFAAEPAARPGRARYVAEETFASAAIREFLYVTLYTLLLDALASEHGARLVATQSAERWVQERTEKLRRHLAAARREASTQEMIEIAVAARAR
jgi:F-type H+-transporting ATPase subunit gamma